jgi:hypothetical protein
MSIVFLQDLLNLFLLLAGMENMLANNVRSAVQSYILCSVCSKMKFEILRAFSIMQYIAQQQNSV